jgi:hypothetical protein
VFFFSAWMGTYVRVIVFERVCVCVCVCVCMWCIGAYACIVSFAISSVNLQRSKLYAPSPTSSPFSDHMPVSTHVAYPHVVSIPNTSTSSCAPQSLLFPG